MNLFFTLLLFLFSALKTVTGQGGPGPGGPTGPGGVPLIEFMTQSTTGDPSTMTPMSSSQLQDMLYISQSTLTPSASATICTWLYMNLYRLTNVIFSAGTGPSPTGFQYISLQVYSKLLYVQTVYCSIPFNYTVELRRWTHICVAFGTSINVYVNGNLTKALKNNNCLFNGTEIITSNASKVVLGGSPMLGVPIPGKLADVRFYNQILTASQVAAVQSFDTSVRFIPILTPSSNSSPSGRQISTIQTQEIQSSITEIVWMHVPAQLTYNDSVKVCNTFGGSILTLPIANNTILTSYVQNVLQLNLQNLWASYNLNNCTTVTVSTGSVSINTNNCTEIFCSLCTIPRNVNYKLIGFKSDPLRLSKLQDQYNFDSDDGYRVAFNPTLNKLYLMNVLTNVVFADAENDVAINDVMGRQNWNNSNGNVVMTLSSCDDNQFTCTDGSCVQLKQVCDFSQDCGDSTDEMFCKFTESRPDFYDYSLSGETNKNIDLNLTLLMVYSLNMNDQTVDIELQAIAKWRDFRVVFHNIHPNNKTSIAPDDITYYWHPNIILEGVVNDNVETLSMAKSPGRMYVTALADGKATTYLSQEVLEVQGSDVIITHEKKAVITAQCPLDLFIYPFDVQTCYVNVTLVGFVNQDAVWNPSTVNTTMASTVVMQLFDFLTFNGTISPDDPSKITLKMRIARRYGSQILLTFLPCVMMLLIGLSIFGVPLHDLADRLTVSISTLIVMGALFMQISSTLPQSASPKMIDVWMFFQVFIMMIVFFAQIIIYKIFRAARMSDNNKVSPMSALKMQPMMMMSRMDEEEEGEDLPFPVAVNFWTAVVCVVLYVAFCVVYFIYSFVARASLISQV